MSTKMISFGVGLVFALVQMTSANAAWIGTFAGNDNATNVRDNLIENGVNVDCDVLTLLVRWNVESGGLDIEGVDGGSFASQFNVNGLTYDNKDGGTWSLIDGADLGGYKIVAYAAMGGNQYNLFTPEGDGPHAWSTDGLTIGNNQTAGISHLSIYGCASSVPEPASVLAGLMALGLGVVGRKYLA